MWNYFPSEWRASYSIFSGTDFMSVNFQLSFPLKVILFCLDSERLCSLSLHTMFWVDWFWGLSNLELSKDAVLVCSGSCLDKPEVVWLVLLYAVFHFPLVSNFHFIFFFGLLTVGVWAGFLWSFSSWGFLDFLIGKFKYLITFGKMFAMVFQMFFILFSFPPHANCSYDGYCMLGSKVLLTSSSFLFYISQVRFISAGLSPSPLTCSSVTPIMLLNVCKEFLISCIVYWCSRISF